MNSYGKVVGTVSVSNRLEDVMLSETPLAVIATCVGVKHLLLIVHVM